MPTAVEALTNPHKLTFPAPFGTFMATIVEAETWDHRGETVIRLVWESGDYRWGDALRDPARRGEPSFQIHHREKNAAVGWIPGDTPAHLVGVRMRITVQEYPTRHGSFYVIRPEADHVWCNIDMFHHEVGTRVTRRVALMDGTWEREGDACLAASPLKRGKVVTKQRRDLAEHLFEHEFTVRWDDGTVSDGLLSHGIQPEAA